MSTVQFSCNIAASNPNVPLGLEIWIDDHCVANIDHVSQAQQIDHEFADNDGDHKLRIVLKNKRPEHTTVDAQGNILSDAVISVRDIAFDQIDCTKVMQEQAVYIHNFNGSQPEIQDQFFGDLGCNGTVELAFSSPLYLWLLENI